MTKAELIRAAVRYYLDAIKKEARKWRVKSAVIQIA
jgi:metal-responsive CopG/Arc/MetJ family transcriptional regulator